MKRRTLDVLFSVGGLMLAGLLLVLAVVMTSNDNLAAVGPTSRASERNSDGSAQ